MAHRHDTDTHTQRLYVQYWHWSLELISPIALACSHINVLPTISHPYILHTYPHTYTHTSAKKQSNLNRQNHNNRFDYNVRSSWDSWKRIMRLAAYCSRKNCFSPPNTLCENFPSHKMCVVFSISIDNRNRSRTTHAHTHTHTEWIRQSRWQWWRRQTFSSQFIASETMLDGYRIVHANISLTVDWLQVTTFLKFATNQQNKLFIFPMKVKTKNIHIVDSVVDSQNQRLKRQRRKQSIYTYMSHTNSGNSSSSSSSSSRHSSSISQVKVCCKQYMHWNCKN